MNEARGYIKLYRTTLDNPVVCKDSEHLAVWVYLLLNATHAGYSAMFKGKRIELQPGQLITGRRSMAAKLKVSDSKVQRILKVFEIEQQIEQQTASQNRLISVLNWQKYQESEPPIEQQVNHDRTTSEPRVNTNKNVKNVKTVKNVKNEYTILDSLSIPLASKIREFIDNRKQIKSPMTERAVELMMEKLQKLSPDENEQINILNQSIINGWKGIFPLKEQNNAKQKRNEPQQDYQSPIDWIK